ncbi:unnamed protein product, partial [marine sediment metagenome]
MIPPEFSVKGPHGTRPWLGFAEYVKDSQPRRATVLLWARNEEEATRYTQAHVRGATEVQVVPCDPDHKGEFCR